MLRIIREVSKLCMFIVLWLFPALLSRWNGDNNFLWFYVLSFVVTVGVFGHYENLEEIDNAENEEDDEPNE